MLIFILTFSIRIGDLLLILCILSINIAGIVASSDCPLNVLEKKYLPTSCLDFRTWMITHILPINYHCDHTYEKTLEYLLNAWTITALKCLFLIIWRLCRPFQMVNSGELYTVT